MMKFKETLFTPDMAGNFMAVVRQSPQHYQVMNAVFAEFEPKDWRTHKKVILSYLLDASLKHMNLVEVDYNFFSTLLNKDNWRTVLSNHADPYTRQVAFEVNFYSWTKLEPFLIDFLAAEQDQALSLAYITRGRYSNSKDYIKTAEKLGLDSMQDNHLELFLKTIEHFDFHQRLQIVEALGADPLHSQKSFNLFAKIKGNEPLNIHSIPEEMSVWLVEKIKTLSNDEKKVFFDNKFGLKYKRDALHKELSSMKDLSHTQALDYSYLITFCNFILNPECKVNVTELAMALDPYLATKMRDTTEPWWDKVQRIIERQSLRAHLIGGQKNNWSAVYEKIKLDKIVGQASSAPKRKNKL